MFGNTLGIRQVFSETLLLPTHCFNGKTVDASKVNALLSLSLEKQDTFTLTTQGKEAKKALDALQSLFETLMKDDVEVTTVQKVDANYMGETLEGDIIAKGVAIAPAMVYTTETIQHDNSLTFKEAIDKTIKSMKSTSGNTTLTSSPNAILTCCNMS